MTDEETVRRETLVRRLERQGVLRTPRIIAAMREVPRHVFLPDRLRSSAYYDTPLGIGSGQTISAPHMVAMMLEALDLQPGQKVLEVGGGSGYHAALTAHVVGPEGRVYAVERIPRLVAEARRHVAAAGFADRVEVVQGDGSQGLPPNAPYDRIFVTCAAPDIPPPLVEELTPEGRLLIPVGSRHYQDLLLVTVEEGQPRRTHLGGCVFVPLVGKYGF